jgi:hypothetical protein
MKLSTIKSDIRYLKGAVKRRYNGFGGLFKSKTTSSSNTNKQNSSPKSGRFSGLFKPSEEKQQVIKATEELKETFKNKYPTESTVEFDRLIESAKNSNKINKKNRIDYTNKINGISSIIVSGSSSFSVINGQIEGLISYLKGVREF